MDRSVCHILYTRFNLRLSFQKTRFGEPVRTLNWHETRFKLFRDYCFNSLSKQSVLHFEWYIYFDFSTPDEYLLEIEKLTSNFLPIRIVKLEEKQEIAEHLNLKIKTLNKNYVILTRIDNDDAFHFDFVKTIQYLLRPSEFKVLNLQKGYSFDITEKVSFSQFLDAGPFFSVIEKISKRDLVGLKMGSHMLVDHSKSLGYDQKALWCQIIHKQNVSNFNHGRIMFSNSHLGSFGIVAKTKGRFALIGFGLKHYLYMLPKAKIRNLLILLHDKVLK